MTRQIKSSAKPSAFTTELLILPDGRILVHNLTRPFAEMLRELNPNDEHITPRIMRHPSAPIEPLPGAWTALSAQNETKLADMPVRAPICHRFMVPACIQPWKSKSP